MCNSVRIGNFRLQDLQLTKIFPEIKANWINNLRFMIILRVLCLGPSQVRKIRNLEYQNTLQVLSEFPAFNLFSPTVINLDGDGGEMEVITALSTGNIHAFSPSSIHVSGQRKGFPLSHNTIHGQVFLMLILAIYLIIISLQFPSALECLYNMTFTLLKDMYPT